jgi:heat shock protein HtpX
MYSQIDSNKRKTNILIIIFTMFIIAIGWFFNAYMGYGYGAVVVAVVVSVIMTLVSYYKGDSIALASSGAKETTKEENPYIYRMVENLAITAGMPVPKVYVINSPALNAFATGRDPEHASIAVTTGIVQALENEELEGVLAHELSHIKNYDIRVSMIAFGLVSAIGLLSDIVLRMMFFGDRRDSNVNPVLLIVGVAVIILAPIIAVIVQMAVSRQREYLADATGVLTTRHPEALATALEKLRQYGKPMKHQNTASAHLFFSNPLKPGFFSKLFSSHPPLEDRIARLRGNDGKF